MNKIIKIQTIYFKENKPITENQFIHNSLNSIRIEQWNRPPVIANTPVPCSGTLMSIFIQVKHESNSRLVAKPTRNSKSNFLLVLFSLLELLVELLRSFLVLYHRSKDIWTWLFGLKFPFRFHSDSGYSGLWPTEIWSDCCSWLVHFELRRIFYIEDILSQDSFLVVVLLTNRSKWITMLI